MPVYQSPRNQGKEATLLTSPLELSVAGCSHLHICHSATTFLSSLTPEVTKTTYLFVFMPRISFLELQGCYRDNPKVLKPASKPWFKNTGIMQVFSESVSSYVDGAQVTRADHQESNTNDSEKEKTWLLKEMRFQQVPFF